jgi:hypothetical protein
MIEQRLFHRRHVSQCEHSVRPVGRSRNSKTLPLVSCLFFLYRLLDILSSGQAFEDGVDRSQGVGIPLQAETCFGQPVLNFSGSERFCRSLQNLTNGVGKPFGLNDVVQLLNIGCYLIIVVEGKNASQACFYILQTPLNFEALPCKRSQYFQVPLRFRHKIPIIGVVLGVAALL